MPKKAITTMTISISIPIELNYAISKIVEKVNKDDKTANCTKSSLICALLSSKLAEMSEETPEKAD